LFPGGILDAWDDLRSKVFHDVERLCRLLGHRRSRTLAYTDADGTWKSRCGRCGAKMVRVRRRRWVIDPTSRRE